MIRHSCATVVFSLIFFGLSFAPVAAQTQASRSDNPQEWEKVLEAGKKEGTVRLSIPASAELRKQLEDGFKKRFARA